MATEREKQRKANKFLRQFAQGRAGLDKLTNAGIRDVEKLIREFKVEIKARLSSLSPVDPKAPFLVRQLPGLTIEVDRALAEMSRLAKARIQENMVSAFEAGSKISFDSIKAAGVPVAFPSVSPEILRTLASVKDIVLDEIVSKLSQRINSQIQQAAAGLVPASGAIRNVERLLRTSEEVRRGLRRRIGFGQQAEAIVRTETMRVFSNAQQAASVQIAQTIPGLRKRWIVSSQNTRRGHQDAHDRYAPGGETGPIRIDQKFQVSEHSRTGRTDFITVTRGGKRVIKLDQSIARRGRIITDRMLFPRDPSADVANIISCTCTSLDVLPELDAATDRAKGIISV